MAANEAKAEWFCCKAHTAGAGTRPGTRLVDVATWEFARRLDELNAWAYAQKVNAAAVPALRPNHLASALHTALVQLSEVQFIRSTPEASRRGSGND